MTIQQAAQQALDIQDDCNLSGVVFAFERCMRAVCDDSQARGTGTKERNQHPIVTMFLLKLCELNGCGSTLNPAYEEAERTCKEIAACSGTGSCVWCDASKG